MNTTLKRLLKEVSPLLAILSEHNGNNYPVWKVIPGTILAGENEVQSVTINLVGDSELTWEVLEPLAKHFISRPKISWSIRATDSIDENHGAAMAIDIY